jgi:hypothetical protein
MSVWMAHKQAKQHGGEPNPLDTTGLCLLSLDGGGVRGLSTLYILKGLMTRLNGQRQVSGLLAVKPCEVFDLIGGTSTGGCVVEFAPCQAWLMCSASSLSCSGGLR